MQTNLLHGPRVRLTAYTKADLPALARWYADSTFFHLYDSGIFQPRSEQFFTDKLESFEKATDAFQFAVRLHDSEAMIGLLELDGIQWANQTGWLSIGFGEQAYQGKGYGYEATQLALKFAFNELNLYRVQLSVFSYNDRAIALYEKIGFQREGIYREYLNRGGERYDIYLYGLLRREWITHQPTPVAEGN